MNLKQIDLPNCDLEESEDPEITVRGWKIKAYYEKLEDDEQIPRYFEKAYKGNQIKWFELIQTPFLNID